jgi:tRNA A-37 threonylcarbamoyl transferase component Bud32/tetratricopeptide (TPR) repeat protein
MGRFELIERLGIGGFGSVWKARDKELDRTVAIKLPRQALSSDEQEKFFREARAAAQLRHPNIVSVHEVGRDGDSVYIVSDFVRGVTLGDWLTGQQLTSREAAALCAKIADALHHAHEQGVVHRDLKPANIMIDGNGEPHLMDFGLARREVGEVTVTMDGHVIGTPAYMSPEQAEGKAHGADRRSDVYSLGVILFQLLTGELPFRGNARMIMHQVIHDEPPSPRKLNSSVPRDLETITLRCIEKDPGRRYQSAKKFSDEIGRFLDGDPIHSRPISRVERGWRWTRRNRLVASLGAGFFLALVIGITVSTVMAVRASQNALRANENARLVAEQRDLAQKNLLLAESAVDDYLMRVADDERLKHDDFHDLRTQLLETAAPFYEQFAKQRLGDDQSQAKRANAYARLAAMHGMIGDKRFADEFNQAIAIGNELVAKHPNEQEYRRNLADHHAEFAWNLLVVGKGNLAEPHFIAAQTLLEDLTDAFPDEPGHRHKLAQVHEQFGLQAQHDDKTIARKHYEQAIEIEEALLKTSPGKFEYQNELALASFRLGVLLTVDQPKAAQQYLKTAAETQRKLVAAQPKEPEYRCGLAESLAHLAVVSSLLGEDAVARELGAEAVEIQMDVFVQFPRVVKYRTILEGTYSNYAKVLRALGDTAAATKQEELQRSLQRKTEFEFPDIAAAREALRQTAVINQEYLRPPIAELRSLIGKETTVEFRVQNIGGNERRYLNSNTDFRHKDTFTAVVQPDQVATFNKVFNRLKGKIVRVTGTVEERLGQPQIPITNLAKQFKVVGEPESPVEPLDAAHR